MDKETERCKIVGLRIRVAYHVMATRRVFNRRGGTRYRAPHTSRPRLQSLINRVSEFLGALLPQGSTCQYGKTHSLGAFQYVTAKVREGHLLTFSRLQVI